MSQPPRPKPPMEVLQSMINAILIETGKALRSADKGGARRRSPESSREDAVLAISEKFHEALDDLECDIIRAKSVLLRDLEELKAQRIARENPPRVIEEVRAENTMQVDVRKEPQVKVQAPPKIMNKVVDEKAKTPKLSPPKIPASQPVPNTSVAAVAPTAPAESKPQQVPTPPKSSNESNDTSNPTGLGIDTQVTTTTSAPNTAELQNSSIDSLFDITDNDHDTGGSDLNFDTMDFTNTQTQHSDFDLSTFGNNSQDFTMTDFHTTDNDANKTTANTTKQEDDSMDLDLNIGTAGADDSVFEDMIFFGDGGNDGEMGGDAEMDHGEFDEAFFGIGN